MTKFHLKKSIKHLFLLIHIGALVIILAGMFTVYNIIVSQNKTLVEERFAETQKDVSRELEIFSSERKNYANYNSYWDALANSFKSHDTGWIEMNFLKQLSQYNINYIWFDDDKMQQFIYYDNQTHQKGEDYTTDKISFKSALEKNAFQQFYTFHKNNLVEIFSAPVQYSSDIDRTSKPTGYLLIGTIVNNDFIKKLAGDKKGLQYELVTTPGKVEIDKDECSITYYKELLNEQGKPVSWFKVKKLYPDLKLFQQKLSKYLILFLILVFVILIIFYFLMIAKVYKPIHALASSLKNQNPAPLKNIVNSNNEFGLLARLVINSFDHKEKLLGEIEIRKRSEYDLQEAMYKVETSTLEKIKAEQSASAKTDFLSTMSHEIRTPINGVIGIINLLKEEELNSRQKEYVNILDFSSKHLLSLISDVLDFSKIETGKIEFEKNSFDLQHLCNNVYKLFKPKADEKMIALTFSSPEDNTASLYGDNIRLSQILTNLLGNAVKFTNSGSVHFGYKILSNNATQVTYEFFVKDTGIGMDDEEQRKIFDSFSQASAKINREYGGSGLGLTISKKLIEMQGGTISLVSRRNVGSTFSFVITYEKHAFVGTLPQPSSKKLSQQNLQGLKVLVAEDNKINSFVLQKFLNKWHVDARFAVTGVEAVRFVQESDFDLILMDLQMPELDGQQATSAIRALTDPKISKIPIIALTADASVSTQELLLKNGFNHFITKPFNPDALYRILKKYFNAE